MEISAAMKSAVVEGRSSVVESLVEETRLVAQGHLQSAEERMQSFALDWGYALPDLVYSFFLHLLKASFSALALASLRTSLAAPVYYRIL